MRRGSSVLWGAAFAFAAPLAGCGGPPPPSQFPDADTLLARMRASHACSRGVSGEAKLDYFGEQGRVRGNLLYLVSAPDRVRLDVFSPFGANEAGEGKGAPQAETSEASPAGTKPGKDEIANLKAELTAMQVRLEQLSRR